MRGVIAPGPRDLSRGGGRPGASSLACWLACMLARLQSRGRIRRLAALGASLVTPQTQFGHKLVKLLITYVAGSRLPTGEDSRDVDGTLPAACRGDDIADEAHFSTGRDGGCGGQNFVEKIFVCVLCVLELG